MSSKTRSSDDACEFHEVKIESSPGEGRGNSKDSSRTVLSRTGQIEGICVNLYLRLLQGQKQLRLVEPLSSILGAYVLKRAGLDL